MTLLTLQRDLRDWLDTGSDECAARFAASAQPGLGIYQNNFRAQLADCLEDSFAVTLAWLGGEAFHAAIVAHVAQVPPSSWTLDLYGQGFPATLRHLYPDDPEVGELATIELALSDAFVAADAPELAADLAGIDWDRARIVFVPSLRLHPMATNAPAIWSAIGADDAPPPATLLPAAQALMVWRSGEQCRFRSIADDEREALAFLREPGATFGALCEVLGDDRVDAVGTWLGQWLADAMIMRIGVGSD